MWAVSALAPVRYRTPWLAGRACGLWWAGLVKRVWAVLISGGFLMSLVRSRWAAVGAVSAITLGAGGIGLVDATSPSGAATFVSITPCRVLDTRPAFKVGPKSTPLGPGEVHTVSAHGDNGRCADIPATATGLSLNITATGASLPTFLTIWATGSPQPDSSSLNPVPGQPPTPNAVTTGLSANGQFDIFNLQGTVDVIGDINGYYTDHDHDDRYYGKPQVDAAVAGASEVIWINNEIVEPVSLRPMVPDRTFRPIEFTTTVGGTAIIRLDSPFTLICESTGAYHYLVVDGQPVDGSHVFTSGGGTGLRAHEGIVDQLAAGSHTAELGGQCRSSNSGSFTTGGQQRLSVIVDAN